MTKTELQDLTTQVQYNCHISDALHARNYSLCIYLLKMREYFRWEHDFGYDERLPEKQLGTWLVERERLWESLEEEDYQAIHVDGLSYAPFEPVPVNDALLPSRLVYSGGYGGLSKPHFFLADLVHTETLHGQRIFITTREHARDLTAPPAMSLAGEIYVRRDSLQRMLWEKIEEWRWHQKENAMSRTLAHYPVNSNLHQALSEMTSLETDAVVQHELGELEAGQLLGPKWEVMLNAIWHTRAELVSRAVRDHLADCLTTLPKLLDEKRHASLHFYMANLSGMRQVIFPALQQAYQHWVDTDSLRAMRETVLRGKEHWLGIARQLLDAYADEDNAAAERIDAASQGIEM